MLLVTTQAQFVAAVNAAIEGCYVENFATNSKFTVTGTMNFTLRDCGHDPVGWNGNGLKIINDGGVNNGGGILKITSSQQNRSFIATGTAVSGGGYSGHNSGTCVTLTQPNGGAPIYKFTLRDWWLDYCGGHGMALTGDVYEGSVTNLQTENHNGSGIYLSHLPGNRILSNIYLIGLNSSRNKAYALEMGEGAFSAQVTQFSFVNNAKGGIKAPWGIRSVTDGNCENSGQICVDSGTTSYSTVIFGVEASTDNSLQHAGGTGPMKYLYATSGGNVMQMFNVMTCYGANCTGVQLKKP